MILFIKGVLIGICKILPGISGSVIAISLDEYENMINAITKLNKKNIFYLFKIGSGILLAIILGSKILLYLYDKFELYLYIVFSVLIIMSIPKILVYCKNYLYTIITIIIILLIYLIDDINIGKSYFLMGNIEALSMIIPGLSGTAIFTSLGLYDDILQFMSTIYILDIFKIIPFFLGFFFSSILSIKLIQFFLKKYKSETHNVILGLLLSSLFLMIIKR